MKLSIRNATSADLGALSVFSAEYNRPNSSTFQDDFFDWQFEQSAALVDQDDNGVLIAESDGQIAGMSVAGKAPVLICGKKSAGVWHQEWYAAREFKGAGLALVVEQTRRNTFIGCGGRSLDSVNTFNRIRPTIWFEIPRLFVVLDEAKTFEILETRNQSAQRFLALQNIPAPGTAAELEEIAAFDDEYERTWAQFSGDIWLCNDRSAAYMNWRYVAHPRFHYRLARTRTPQGPAYFVWRVEAVTGTDSSVVRLCEAIGEAAAIVGGFPLVFDLVKSEGGAFMDFFCTHHTTNAALLEAGMRPQVTTAEFDLPRLFQPLAADIRKTINFGYSLPRNELPPMFYRYGETYITKGDSNQDRPNP